MECEKIISVILNRKLEQKYVLVFCTPLLF